MSAPHEVWLSPGWAAHHETRSIGLRDGADKVRYIRADLTCEECEHSRSRHDNDDPCPCPAGFFLGPLAPACVKIVPKVAP